MNGVYDHKSSSTLEGSVYSAVNILDSSSQSESLQRKADLVNNTAQRAAPPRPNNTGMPDNLKSGIESLSGFSMDDVRVHYNSSKPATVQALAYTQGTDIHVAPGQEKHLPHEAWHVAQQMAGRVSPTTNINGMPVNDNAALEHEADVMGEKAVGQKYSINEKKHTTSIKNDAIQNYSFRQMKYNTNQNVMQCVNIKVYDEIVLPDQATSRSESTSTPPVVNKNNTISSSVPADSPTTPAEDTSIPSRHRSANVPPKPSDDFSIYFKSEIIKALNKIKDEYYVQKLLHFPHLNGVKITPTFDNSLGSGWKNGELDGDDCKLVMHLVQCNSMFRGTPTDYENAPIKHNVPIYLTLLHELGHAYQFYLQKENEDDNYQIFSRKFFSGLDDSTKDRLKKYPLFLEALNTLNTKPSRLRLYEALYSYGIKEPLNEIYTLIKNDNDTERDKTIKKILDTIEKIALIANNPDHDSDNLFMNEIPYTTSHALPIRKHYTHAYEPQMDINFWKLQVFVEEQNLENDDIFAKEEIIREFFSGLSKKGCNVSDLLEKVKDNQYLKNFYEHYKNHIKNQLNKENELEKMIKIIENSYLSEDIFSSSFCSFRTLYRKELINLSAEFDNEDGDDASQKCIAKLEEFMKKYHIQKTSLRYDKMTILNKVKREDLKEEIRVYLEAK